MPQKLARKSAVASWKQKLIYKCNKDVKEYKETLEEGRQY